MKQNRDAKLKKFTIASQVFHKKYICVKYSIFIYLYSISIVDISKATQNTMDLKGPTIKSANRG